MTRIVIGALTGALLVGLARPPTPPTASTSN